eukprot:262759_1
MAPRFDQCEASQNFIRFYIPVIPIQIVIREDLEIAIYKICFTLLKEMLSAMKSHPSMKDLFCNKVVKISFDFAFHREYKAKRPEYDRTLKTHIFGIHHLMFKIFGNDV